MGVSAERRPCQLRMYRIAAGMLDEFVERWRRGVKPLRERVGFTVPDAWVIPEENRFVWVLCFPGPGSFEEADRAYYDSPERQALHPDPAELIEENLTYWIWPVAP